MKIRKHFIFAAMLLGLSLTACNQSLPKITGYTIDENNNIVVIYDNGNTEIIGNLTDQDVGDHVTSVTISEDGYYVINGVKTNIKATEVYTVSFNTGFSTTIPEQKVFEGHKVEKPQIDRTGYELDGWFCNDEEWRFNSDVVLNDMTLTAHWTAKQYTISFVNEKGINPGDMIVTYDSQVILPNVSSVEGYTFGGWYNGSTKVNNGTWTIADNVTLTAKWTANTYTVTLNANGGSVSPSTKQVTYGQNYTLPVPTNSFGSFKGWYYGDVKITNENGASLAPWTYTQNITATTNWIEEINSLSQFKAIAQKARSESNKNYNYKKRPETKPKLNKKEDTVWISVKTSKGVVLRLNKDNTLLQKLCKNLSDSEFNQLINLIGKSFPLGYANSQNISPEDYSENEIIAMAKKLYFSFKEEGVEKTEIHKKILQMEPFNKYVALLCDVFDELEKEDNQ